MPPPSPDTPDLRDLLARLDDALPADAGSLRRRLRGLDERRPRRGKAGGRGRTAKKITPHARARILEELTAEIEASIERRERRANLKIKLNYPPDLPVSERRDEIAEAIANNHVIVVCGETGSGKTTQIPKICLGLGRGRDRLIGHTQPRRIAARSVGQRLADELGCPFGSANGALVGAKIRFNDQTGDDTLVKLMTDGILLAETPRDRLLERYDTIIIDEAHERSLNIDFLLGYLATILPRRPDLKLIITSATIDPERFAEHFAGPKGPAPIVRVSGRTYPVEVRYRPLRESVEASNQRDESDTIGAVLDAMDEIDTEPPSFGHPSDVLVFMPGEREIRETANALRRRYEHDDRSSVEILPLYARLSPQEQQKVFKSHWKNRAGRRVVIATNVAETSITVPGIKYVIDPGTARVSRYSARSKVQGLPVEPVSRAAADQRKGRCGRVGPGVCFRLFSEDDFNTRDEFTQPEILRTNLASVVLQMAALRLGSPADFPFVEPPDRRLIKDGYDTLDELGAVDEQFHLTPTGRELARLPVDPRLGRMILAGRDENCLPEVIIIAAALSVQDPRNRPPEEADKADEAHARFAHDDSDFLSDLELWHFYHDSIQPLSRSKRTKACAQNYLVERRLREWADVVQQIRDTCRDLDMPMSAAEASPSAIHRALLAGLLTNIGRKDEGYEYAGTRGARFHIFPGSAAFDAKPGWLMAAELVRTTRLFARRCAPIDPAWVEDLGQHLIKKSHANARWETKNARVVADERVMLLGLEIVKQRKVPFGKIDAPASREIFIHRALVEGEYESGAPCLVHNRDLIASIETLENKARRRDLLAEHEAIFRFYDDRLPPDTWSGQRFERWYRTEHRKDPRALFMSTGDILTGDAGSIRPEDFPDSLDLGGADVPARYQFDPQADDDGVTLDLPVEALGHIGGDDPTRLIPGLLAQKVEALMRTLPKSKRRHFDIAQAAARVAPVVQKQPDTVARALAAELSRISGIMIDPAEFREADLPPHLSVRVRVTDKNGKELAAGRDVADLRARFADCARSAVRAASDDQWNRTGLKDWDVGDLPESVEVSTGRRSVRAYPAIVDLGDSAGVTLFESSTSAARAHDDGVARLYTFRLKRDLKWDPKRQPDFPQIAIAFTPFGSSAELADALRVRMARVTLVDGQPPVRTFDEFTARLDAAWHTLGREGDEVMSLAKAAVAGITRLRARLDGDFAPQWKPAQADLRDQLARLAPPGFLASVPTRWLRCYPRFLRAMDMRLERLRGADAGKDRRLQAEIRGWIARHDDKAASHAKREIRDPALEELRWMIEEYRVSLFAQSLRTSVPVSPKRLESVWYRVVE